MLILECNYYIFIASTDITLKKSLDPVKKCVNKILRDRFKFCVNSKN